MALKFNDSDIEEGHTKCNYLLKMAFLFPRCHLVGGPSNHCLY